MADKPLYPPGSLNANGFNFFNAVSFQIMMGAPVILFAKGLGASSTALGIIAALTPLMTVLQLPASHFLGRFSYRGFVLSGWTVRTVFIFVVAAIPILGFLGKPGQLTLLVCTLVIFNILRGISTTAWLPWITALIPDEVRGRFLARDQLFMYLGSVVSLGASALIMSDSAVPWEFVVVFGVSALGATASLFFIRRIPDVEPGEVTRMSAMRVPWRAIVSFPPFAKLLGFNVLFMILIGSLGVFTVEYLREVPKFGMDTILVLSGISFVGPILTLLMTGKAIDRVGSKPVLRFALCGFVITLSGWAMMSGGILPATIPMVAALNFLTGLSAANFHLANQRISMATMPSMGRNHFFALFTVISSLGLGAAPVLWGITLDLIGVFEASTGGFEWHRHSIYFVALFAWSLLALWAVSWLEEARAGVRITHDEIDTRFQAIAKNWQR